MSQHGMPFLSAPQAPVRGAKGDAGRPGFDGSKGTQGYKGEPGESGLCTKIVFAINNVDPINFPKNGVLEPHFDDEYRPAQQIRVAVGESVVHKPSETIWTYQPRSGFLGWINTGKLATNITNIPGPVGQEGEKGDRGEKGLAGADGVNGLNGLRGHEGRKGEIGLKGDRGFPGKTGSTGVKGEKGLDGTDGADGLDGTDGVQGIKGPKGEEGLKGETGNPGFTGSKGERGDDADALRFGLIPRAALSYNGALDTISNKHNVGAIKRLNTGLYRVRFERKLASDTFVVMSQAVVKEVGKNKAKQIVVTEKARSYCIVEVTDPLTGEYVDATIDVVIYNFVG